MEAELIEVEAQALLEITDENRNRLEAQVGIMAIQANGGAVVELGRRVGHRWDYKPGAAKRTLALGWCQAGAQHAAPLQIHRISLRTSREQRGRGGGGRRAGPQRESRRRRGPG